MTDSTALLTTGQPIIEHDGHLTARDAANPWGLTPRQLQAVRALIVGGCRKRAASALGLGPHAIDDLLWRVHQKMKISHSIIICVTVDRWDRGQS